MSTDNHQTRFFTPEGLEDFYEILLHNTKEYGEKRRFAEESGWSAASVSRFLLSVEQNKHLSQELISPIMVLNAAKALINPKTKRKFNPYSLLARVAGFKSGKFPAKFQSIK